MGVHNVSNYLKQEHRCLFSWNFGYPLYLLFCIPGKESVNVTVTLKCKFKNFTPSPYERNISY